ncbi:hypothetical protein CAPTEDRAFT_225025 [Capitella teleta]|uniref:L-serine ammonia-lyase n=1 Tax=Capitella teleta TaxID=283909 RepID=R7UQX8_CAPTE|nr:hypothetical protein CAPTEDRAFT_225025 [Capitella teleta]|eukprot:ELU08518.1 hypothetical protein CAPTEDRAFT_225025 [Capitella teleta]
MDSLKLFAQRVEAIYKTISPHLYKTPLLYCPTLSSLCKDSSVFIKLESEQVTGSFKARGALSKLSIIASSETLKSRGAVTASSGNHALACAYASKIYGVDMQMYLPEGVSKSKVSQLKLAGANLVIHGADCMFAETKAREVSEIEGKIYVSPYNDTEVMIGQATVGLEILTEMPDVSAVFVSVGGGGLIGGLATYLKAKRRDIKIIGCQPIQSKVMYESVKAGKLIFEESGETLSDGTKGGVEEGAVTFEPCRDYVDDWIVVSEEEISSSVFFMLNEHCKTVEGSAGVAIAAYQQQADRYKGHKIAIVSCGCRISPSTLGKIIAQHSA